VFFYSHVPAITALLFASATACSADRDWPRDDRKRYLCSDGQMFDIVRSKNAMIVRVGEVIFNNLQARPGSIGQRYTDGEATLIIDGNEAVFVDGHDLMLRSCVAQA
jgi:hypothetical protein